MQDVQAAMPTSERLLLEQPSYYVWRMHSRCRDMMRDAGVVLRGRRRATSRLGLIPARVVVIGVRLCRQQTLSTDYTFRTDDVRNITEERRSNMRGWAAIKTEAQKDTEGTVPDISRCPEADIFY